jgi:uncharacterized protein DUF5996
MTLPSLPYADWETTKTTLHLWTQIVGKIRLKATPRLNHWWNVSLRPNARGLTTQRMHAGDSHFQIQFDFIDHRLVLVTDAAEAASFPLRDGLSVAEFYRKLFAMLEAYGIRVPILAKPYGVPMTTPFAKDTEHRSYDAAMVRRWWDVIRWTADVLDEFASRFAGKQSPVQLFWHSFDLAMARYSGGRAGGPRKDDPVEREAYSHEVIAFGFWPGDPNTPAPTYYTYTAPEPATLTTEPLASGGAWYPSGSGHLGGLSYDTVRNAPDPRAALLAFMQSGYEAGTRTANWDTAALAHE